VGESSTLSAVTAGSIATFPILIDPRNGPDMLDVATHDPAIIISLMHRIVVSVSVNVLTAGDYFLALEPVASNGQILDQSTKATLAAGSLGLNRGAGAAMAPR
jgi:hypothetical protein